MCPPTRRTWSRRLSRPRSIGAGTWRRFLHITLPGLRYVMIVGMLLAGIASFNGFTLVYLLTSGGPNGATRMYPILAFE